MLWDFGLVFHYFPLWNASKLVELPEVHFVFMFLLSSRHFYDSPTYQLEPISIKHVEKKVSGAVSWAINWRLWLRQVRQVEWQESKPNTFSSRRQNASIEEIFSCNSVLELWEIVNFSLGCKSACWPLMVMTKKRAEITTRKKSLSKSASIKHSSRLLRPASLPFTNEAVRVHVIRKWRPRNWFRFAIHDSICSAARLPFIGCFNYLIVTQSPELLLRWASANWNYDLMTRASFALRKSRREMASQWFACFHEAEKLFSIRKKLQKRQTAEIDSRGNENLRSVFFCFSSAITLDCARTCCWIHNAETLLFLSFLRALMSCAENNTKLVFVVKEKWKFIAWCSLFLLSDS